MADPQITPEDGGVDPSRPVSLSELWTPDIPAERTRREFNNIYKYRADKNIGFLGKLHNAFVGETVAGELYRSMTSPDFKETGYVITDEDIKKYASDLDPHTAQRVATSSESFSEFLYETNEARMTMKRRAELFSGGPLGMASGFGMVMVAAGGEAVLLTLLASAVGGPAGTVAGLGNAAGRVTRARAIGKALAITTAIDIPLETTRYALDKTLRPLDAMIAVGASGVLGSGLAAWKPGLFLRELQDMSKAAQLKQAAALHSEAGDDTLKEVVDRTMQEQVKVTVVPYDEFVESAGALSRVDMFKEAEALGIKTIDSVKGRVSRRTQSAIRKDISEARRMEALGHVPLIKSLSRKGMFTQAERLGIKTYKRKHSDIRADIAEARRMEAVESLSKREMFDQAKTLDIKVYKRKHSDIRKDIAEARRKLGVKHEVTGTKVVDDGGNPVTVFHGGRAARVSNLSPKDTPRSLALTGRGIYFDLRRSVAEGYAKRAGGVVHEVLLNIKKPFIRGTSEWGKKAMKILHAEMAKKVDANWASAEIARRGNKHFYETAVSPGTITKMLRSEGFDGVKDGQQWMVLDASQVVGRTETALAAKSKMAKGTAPVIDAPHPVSGVPDSALVVGGKVRSVGPGPYMVHLKVDEIGIDPGQFKITGHGEGGRETVARAIDKIGPDVATTPVSYRLLADKSEFTRRFTKAFLEVPREHGYNVWTASNMNRRRLIDSVWPEVIKARDMARKAGGKLEDDVIVAAVRTEGDPTDPATAHAVAAIRKFFRFAKKHGQDNGVFVDAIPDDPMYFPRNWSGPKAIALDEEMGKPQLNALVTGAIRNHKSFEAIVKTEAAAKILGKHILDVARNPQPHRHWKDTQQYLLDPIQESLTAELKKAGEFSEDIVESFMDLIIPHLEREPHISYGKRRHAMDEMFEMTMQPLDKTQPSRVVRIDELFNNSLLHSLSMYAQRISAGVEVRKGMEALTGKPNTTIQTLLNRLQKEALEAGDDADFVMWAADHTYRALTGQPIYMDKQKMQHIMAMNAFAQGTIGPTLGFAQVPEIASLVARTSTKAALGTMPSLKDTAGIFTMGIADLAKGRQGLGLIGRAMTDDVAAEIETFAGCVDYRIGDHMIRRLDEMQFDEDYVAKGILGYTEYGRMAAALAPTGIMPMDTFLRTWARQASFQHFVNEAYKWDGKAVTLSKGWWKNSKKRMSEIGLDEADLDRLFKELRNTDIIKVEKSGIFGNYAVKSFNQENIKDLYIMDKFALALKRHTDHTIQRQSFGESPAWVNTGLGKLFAQYRVFMLASKSKQLAAGVSRLDATEAANMVGSAALGILAYKMQTYYRAASMDEYERKLYLARRFQEDQLIKAGILKGSYSSIFPMLIDSASWLIGKEPVFDPSMRTTGLGIDPIRGSVPYSILYGKGWRAFREGTGAMFRGDKLSKEDLRNFKSLIWMMKMPGVDQGIDRLFINPANIPEKK